jgi:uncharacterized membrane protein YtjA (UPF0391 family)
MLRTSILFFVLAIVAAVFGYGGIASGAEDIGKLLLFVFLALAILFFFGKRTGGA